VEQKRRLVFGLLAALVLVGAGLSWWGLHRVARRPVARRAAPEHPTGIVIHHSATPGQVNGRYIGAAQIAESHKRRGFAVRYRGKVYHIGYHYVIREDGVIEPGRPEHCPGAHAKTFNHYLGICLVGQFSTAQNEQFWTPSEPTPEQLRSLLWLCGRLMAKYGISPDHVVRHSDVRDTACPGDRFPFLWLQAQLSSANGPRSARVPRGVMGSEKVGRGI
jgi:N-acetylmuramoyl-L-alanine amidase